MAQLILLFAILKSQQCQMFGQTKPRCKNMVSLAVINLNQAKKGSNHSSE